MLKYIHYYLDLFCLFCITTKPAIPCFKTHDNAFYRDLTVFSGQLKHFYQSEHLTRMRVDLFRRRSGKKFQLEHSSGALVYFLKNICMYMHACNGFEIIYFMCNILGENKCSFSYLQNKTVKHSRIIKLCN